VSLSNPPAVSLSNPPAVSLSNRFPLNIPRRPRSPAALLMSVRRLALCLLAACLPGGAALAAEPTPPAPAATAPAAPRIILRQILFADSLEGAQALQPDPTKGYIVLTGPLLGSDVAELGRRLAAGEGQAISDQLLVGIVQVTTGFFRQRDLPVAEVIIPPQDITKGVLRVAVLRGKFREIKFKGNRWFSDALLRDTLQVQRGEIIRLSQLDQSINWANTNPFRRVRIHIEPIPDTGEANLHIGVEEKLPLRLALSYDNTGNDLLGNDRYTAAITYGNVFGLDHQASYQFTTTHDPDLIQAHAFDYRIPLPWRHLVMLSGNQAKVDVPLYEGYFNQAGRSSGLDLKYLAPLRVKGWMAEGSAMLSFKRSNNNLEFGGAEVFGSGTDTFTASFGGTFIRPDKRGRWVLSLNLTGSPGDVNSRNTDAAYGESRYEARSRFVYGQAWAQRVTVLAPSVSLTSRVIVHGGSSTNLLPSEQFSLGGMGTVRGYKERIFSGERGLLLNQELTKQLPATSLGKRLPPLETSLAFFWDYGRVYNHQVRTIEPENFTLQSVGFGLRANIGTHFSATLDYGRQAKDPKYTDLARGRLHARVTLAY
jgi:hemolysin activation/secretion protein